jgi:hypothetical protein
LKHGSCWHLNGLKSKQKNCTYKNERWGLGEQ